MTQDKRSICIVGASFAGLQAARQLSAEAFDVTLFDPQPMLEWLPNIHELLSGQKRPEDLRMPRAPLIARMGHTWRASTVTRIDHNSLILDDGEQVPFDACIIAVGGVHDTHRVTGALQYGLPFKSVAQCETIGERLQQAARHARADSNKPHVTIVGGGIEGIEALGEILRAYPDDFQIHVVDSASRLLKMGPKTIDKRIRELCRPFAVHFHLGQRVRCVNADSLTLESGETLPSHITIWTGGVAAPRLLRDSALADPATGWGPVNPFLQSMRHNIFIAGDAAQFEFPLGKQAYHALDMGRCAGINVARLLTGKTLQRFRPSPKPQLITFGELDAFMVFGDQAVASPLLCMAKEGIFNLGLLQFSVRDNRDALQHQFEAVGRSVRHAYLPNLLPRHVLQMLPRSRWLR